MQLANAYAAFANGGTLWKPHIEASVSAPDSPTPLSAFTPQAIRQITIPANVRAAMIAGFAGVTADPKGTAYAAFQGFPLDTIPVSGKTGHRAGRTADGKGDTSLFAALFPANAPQYVVVAVVEEGGRRRADRGADRAAASSKRSNGLPTGAPVQALATGKD